MLEVKGFVERIEAGERDFKEADLSGANLTDATLCSCTLEGGILVGTLRE